MMTALPANVYKKIQQVICRPEGTFMFTYSSLHLLDPRVAGGVVLQVPAGQHLFRLERDDELRLHFFHSSPGTGTRVATVDLNEVQKGPRYRMTFTWSPQEIWLYIAPDIPNSKILCAKGGPSTKGFRVDREGNVYQVGDHGVKVMGIRIRQGGKQVMAPTAKEAWDETKHAIKILQDSQPADVDVQLQTVITNLTLTMLVTGFEAYCKTRFLELEMEGITPDVDALFSRFFPKEERQAGIQTIMNNEAKEQAVSLLGLTVRRRAINFQNYGECKSAFNKVYGLKFGSLDCSSETLSSVQAYIQYRHRIVHVSPLLGLLNESEVPPKEPVFPSKETAEDAITCFANLVDAIHAATLALRPAKKP
jgi:hypothetical protein